MSTLDDLVPAPYQDLLRRPVFAVLATVRPDSTAQASPMWFDYEAPDADSNGAGTLRFTHTSKRAKFRNLQANPSMALAIMDPDQPTRYLELRGRLLEAIPDPTGAYYVHLGRRYGNAEQQPPKDSADRVILVMSIEHTVHQ
jgi:PPOX class probable F420-dependent enzyme